MKPKAYKVALICANIGSFDPVFPIKHQLYDYDLFYYTENNLPFPLPNLNSRLKSKYVKIQTHRFLPDYNIYIWIDGSVEIISERFVSRMVELIKESDMAITVHPERSNVYQEINYILDNIDAGKEYLIKRYANEPLAEEAIFYKNKHLPEDHPLYITRLFARWNHERVNRCFDDWWNGCIEFANFDQSMFSYVSWKHGLKIAEFDYLATVDNLIKVHKH